MTRSRTLLLGALALVLFACWWLWWMRSTPIDMTAYAPADALLYVEADDLPRVAAALTSSAAYRALAAPAGLNFNPTRFSLLSTFAARTGIGSAESVVRARAGGAGVRRGQGAADANRSAAAARAGEVTLRPQIALIAETHTGERRARLAVERLGGELARRVYGSAHATTRDAEGVRWTTWTPDAEAAGDAPSRRSIVAAVAGSTAIVGNDEEAVAACLAVRRGERRSLLGDSDLNEMRRRAGALASDADAGGDHALAFGYVSPRNAARLLEIAATLYAARGALAPQAQSAAAGVLPQILPRVAGSVAWSAHGIENGIEDRFFFGVRDAVAERLRLPLAAAEFDSGFASLLPAGTRQTSAYLYRDPEAAWRGARAAVSAQLDFGLAPLVALFADRALEPYGIPASGEFLSRVAAPIATAQLDDETGERLLIAHVRDPSSVLDLLRRRPGTRAETIDGRTLLLRTRAGTKKRTGAGYDDDEDDERGATDDTEAAALVGDHVIIGGRDAVRRCLAAHDSGRTLLNDPAFRQARASFAADPLGDPAGVLSFADDRRSVRDTLRALAALRSAPDPREDARSRSAAADSFSRALNEYAYATSETRLVEGGFERRTRSVFGMFGSLVRLSNDDARSEGEE